MLSSLPLIARNDDLHDHDVRWTLVPDGHAADDPQSRRVGGSPRLVTNDLSVQLSVAVAGIGIALLPEMLVDTLLANGQLHRVLPAWSTPEFSLHLVYPLPRGTLPSVRSFIDFLTANTWHEGRRETEIRFHLPSI
jgi:DNA-binding transcriptional LysR family regulator